MNITFSSVQELKLKYRNMETIKIKQFDGSEKTVILPVRGMVGTLYAGSDRYVVCCNVVWSNKKVGLVRIFDITEDNKDKYVYERDGVEYLTDEAFNKFVHGIDTLPYSLRKNGTWHTVGSKTEPGCCSVTFGHAYPHLDPDF